MADKSLEDDLARALTDDLDDDAEDMSGDKDDAKSGNGKAQKKGGLPSVGIGPVVGIAFGTLVVGAIFGAVLMGSVSGSGTPSGVGQVTSVEAHIPAYDQLDSMRENTISTMSKQFEQYRAGTSGAVNSAEMTALSEANASLSATIAPALESVVRSSVTLDDLKAYLADPEEFTGDDASALQALSDALGDYVTVKDEKPTCEYAGGSVKESLGGADVKDVSAPTVYIASAELPSDGGDCSYVVTVPVATASGDLYVAVFNVGMQNAKISYIGYAGLIVSDDVTTFSEQVKDAAASTLDKQEVEDGTDESATDDGGSDESAAQSNIPVETTDDGTEAPPGFAKGEN